MKYQNSRRKEIKRFSFFVAVIITGSGGGRDRYSGGSASALSCGGEKYREDKQGRMFDGKTMIRREKEEDTKSADNVSRGAIPSRQSLLELVSSKCMSRHTPTHHYYHQQQQVSTIYSSLSSSISGEYFVRCGQLLLVTNCVTMYV
ncbi:hypothetical protein K0M31_002197 [Melipona bicolor]|uniref:Uncharacterized protein n=1 Tax=Melipona bicolor TaxID=60889 RepID=A0AA40GH29_9HYME|nr:hypothetical protein K0M31_002197 [Melipona bicolor]